MFRARPEWRGDDELQAIAKSLFLGIAPERAAELEDLWTVAAD